MALKQTTVRIRDDLRLRYYALKGKGLNLSWQELVSTAVEREIIRREEIIKPLKQD